MGNVPIEVSVNKKLGVIWNDSLFQVKMFHLNTDLNR